MSEQDNIDLVKNAYAAFKRSDIPGLLDLLDEDLDFQHPMSQSIWPWAGHRKGRKAFAEFVEGCFQTIEYELFEPHDFICQSDYVAVVLFERGRVKATGATYDISEVHVFKFKRGKIVQLMIFEDTAVVRGAGTSLRDNNPV
jgi:ketosteroid isomerase-like protein